MAYGFVYDGFTYIFDDINQSKHKKFGKYSYFCIFLIHFRMYMTFLILDKYKN